MLNRKDLIVKLLVAVLTIVVLVQFSRINYLLFHSIAEIFSIIIASSIFIISWNARKQMDNMLLVYLGIAYLFIGIIDLFHTLSYVGMNIFTDYDFYANQLWIGARYLEAISLLVFFILTGSRPRISPGLVFAGYAVITALLLLGVFYWKVFPVCFIKGQGLTPFKKISEYIISAMLVVSLFALYFHRSHFDPTIRKLLIWAIVLTILGELAFTVYISNYGLSNLIGHFLKIASVYCVYKAIIETGLRQPFDLIFRELKQREVQLKQNEEALTISNRNLVKEVEERKKAEEKITAAYREKDILLHEVNHRVKNNMTIVSSLLSMQADQTEDPKARQTLLDSQSRVLSLAAIHEILYHSENFSRVDLGAYLTKLVNASEKSFAVNQKITINVNTEKLMVSVKLASPIGLIVNELITNSFKYAFPETRKGIIDINIKKLNEYEAELIVADNGVGMPQHQEGKNLESLGLRLVKGIAESQLDGTVAIDSRNGTTFTIRFKLDADSR